MSELLVGPAHEAIHRVRVDLIVVGFFQDERPLRASAGQVDWRLCGALSRLIRAGRIEGAAGEALLIPARGGLRARLVMALGLGVAARFDVEAGFRAIGDALARAVALHVRSLAVPLPFAGDAGGAGDLCLDALLDSASTAWQSAQAGSEAVALILVSESERRSELIRALRARAATPPAGLQIQLPEQQRPVAPAGRRAARAGS